MNHKISIRHENGKVVFILDGKGYQVPWEHADLIAKGLTAKAREAEEYCKANRIIADNALMQRSGFPVGLSNHPKIKEESVKEALYNRDLRRYVKNGAGVESIKSRGVVGSPTLLKRAPNG